MTQYSDFMVLIQVNHTRQYRTIDYCGKGEVVWELHGILEGFPDVSRDPPMQLICEEQ